MFGSLGVPELLLIFVVILIVFGPRRIPEIGRTLGKALGEFRKATDDLKSTIEREVRLEELKKITPPTLESFMTPSESVSRTEPSTATPPATQIASVETQGELGSSPIDVTNATELQPAEARSGE
ncbi:MAG: twin-arginine translocase TatA/TatE family subunit [Thermoanaerobaculia bacterium]